jgi:hypothetical protein
MQIYISRNGNQIGPLDETKVLEMLRNGQLSPDDFGIKNGQTKWSRLRVMFPNQTTPVTWSSPDPATGYLFLSPSQSKGSTPVRLLLGMGVLFFLVIVAVNILLAPPKTAGLSEAQPTPTRLTPEEFEMAKEKKMRELFDQDKEKYVQPPAKEQFTKAPYIRGKILYYSYTEDIDKTDSTWKMINRIPKKGLVSDEFVLLDSLFAQTPEETGTIILQKCRPYLVSTYEVKRRDMTFVKKEVPGYDQKCEVVIIDSKISAVIFRKTFFGKLAKELDVPGDFSKVDKLTARIPFYYVAEFISSLPQK